MIKAFEFFQSIVVYPFSLKIKYLFNSSFSKANSSKSNFKSDYNLIIGIKIEVSDLSYKLLRFIFSSSF